MQPLKNPGLMPRRVFNGGCNATSEKSGANAPDFLLTVTFFSENVYLMVIRPWPAGSA